MTALDSLTDATSAVETAVAAASTEPTEAEAAVEEFERLAAAVDLADTAVGELDDDAKAAALKLKETLEAFHRSALVHIVRTLKDDARGKELLFQLVDEPIVHAVLGLHGIVRADPMVRAKRALESVRPYLQSHGGDVELVRIESGLAYVRLQGSCNGCSMSAVTLREGVEEALVSGVEEITGVSVLEDEPTVAFIPLDEIGRKPSKSLQSSGWSEGPEVSAITENELLRFDMSTDGEPLSFIAVETDNRIAVFKNECVHQGLSLDGGCVENGTIQCPWHGFTFEASSGECISNPGAQLEQVPTRIDKGRLWIRVPGAASE